MIVLSALLPICMVMGFLSYFIYKETVSFQLSYGDNSLLKKAHSFKRQLPPGLGVGIITFMPVVLFLVTYPFNSMPISKTLAFGGLMLTILGMSITVFVYAHMVSQFSNYKEIVLDPVMQEIRTYSPLEERVIALADIRLLRGYWFEGSKLEGFVYLLIIDKQPPLVIGPNFDLSPISEFLKDFPQEGVHKRSNSLFGQLKDMRKFLRNVPEN